MDRALRGVVIFGILLISISIAYHFIYSPYKRDKNFNQCLQDSENTLTRKHQEITGHIGDLEKEKTIVEQEANIKLAEFLRENPEPKDDSLNKTGTSGGAFHSSYGRLKGIITGEHYNWEKRKDNIFSISREIGGRIRDITTDYKKIEAEKKIEDEICYKKFK